MARYTSSVLPSTGLTTLLYWTDKCGLAPSTKIRKEVRHLKVSPETADTDRDGALEIIGIEI